MKHVLVCLLRCLYFLFKHLVMLLHVADSPIKFGLNSFSCSYITINTTCVCSCCHKGRDVMHCLHACDCYSEDFTKPMLSLVTNLSIALLHAEFTVGSTYFLLNILACLLLFFFKGNRMKMLKRGSKNKLQVTF